MTSPPPIRVEHARLGTKGMVCTVDQLASVAGLRMLVAGGNAADAAIAASAALAVTTQHMCGMGGDLWALLHGPEQASTGPLTLNASGRAGSGASSAELRAEGFSAMPFKKDLRSVTVPGCVDGWIALHERCGSLDLGEILQPAIDLAEQGFPASPLLIGSLDKIVDTDGNDDYFPDGTRPVAGQVLRRPGIARSLRAIVAEGRDGWYLGEFGDGLMGLAPEQFTRDDLGRSQADWVEPIAVDVWGHRLWTVPPSSQGYLSLGGAVIASGLPLPDDPNDPQWAHYVVEAAKQAAFDRPAVLFEGADGAELVSEARLGPRRSAITADAASELVPPGLGGGTIYLCVVDGDGFGVSLMQSNAAGFGSDLAVPGVGVFLHNRGFGFSVAEGHPAELGPGRRPPSTLSPALITRPDGHLRTVLGAMGGDGQPQVVLQMTARLLQAEQSPGRVMTDPRFTLNVPDPVGFDTWVKSDDIAVALEAGNPWADGLAARGHRIEPRQWGDGLFGHAHLIDVGDGHLAGVADPRARIGAAIGL